MACSRECITCCHGLLRDAKDPKRDRSLRKMAKQGYVNCGLSKWRATFHPVGWVCDRYSQADDEVVMARLEWRAKA